MRLAAWPPCRGPATRPQLADPDGSGAFAPADLTVLASWADRLAAAEFAIGDWTPQHRTEDGTLLMPWFEYSVDVDRFLREIAGAGWVQPFDWPAWAASEAGRRLQTDPAAIGDATPDDLIRLVTTIVRSDRFHEGAIASAFDRGVYLRIAHRAEDLVQHEGS